jgi:hypothetical protein
MVILEHEWCFMMGPSPGINGTDLQTEGMTSMKHHKHVKAA